MCKDLFNTFQRLYIYVKKTRFTIIRRSKRSIRIILNNERSAFTRTGLSFWNLRSSLRAANDERHLTVVERVHHGLFLGPHHGWIHGEILSLKTWKWWRELVFFRRCHRWAGQCVWYGHVRVYRSEWSHSCCDVGNCHSLFLSTGVFIISFGYCTGESSLFFLVGFIVIVKGLYASVACDLHNIWAFNVCFL